MNWTQSQRETIETRNKNILVSAAAGSGKTAVLIERIKRLVIEEKTYIDRFLITTFTNAASAEMKARLEKAIREELEKKEADRGFLKRQLSLIPKANISTFHTFALEIMRRYFYITDLEPGFKIGDETEISIMKNESADQLFEERFTNDYDRFKEFLKKYSSDRNENKIKKNIISLYNEMRSIPDYMRWVKEKTELLKSPSPAEALGLLEFISDEISERLQDAFRLYEKAAEVLDETGIEGLCGKAFEDAGRIFDVIEKAEAKTLVAERLDVFSAFLSDIKFNQMRVSKEQKEIYEDVKEIVASLRKNGKKILDDLKKRYFQRSLREYDTELKNGYEDTCYMMGLISEFENIFKQKKADRNMVDFDDVMHYAIDILKDDMVSAEYKERFKYIFIDEFQDSNMLQESIVERIAGNNNLFMVGDVKQSIYKFRLAEPEIFKRKYYEYSQPSQVESIKIDLNNNFRSKRRITETVNRVFESVMEDYDDNARLSCSIDPIYPGSDTECHIVSSASEVNRYGDLKPEEQLILRLIKENLGREIYDVKKGEIRNIEYKDIVVLSRSKAAISSLERFLNNEGIPAYGENTGGYFETVEIQVFVNLLRVIDNTRQDIPLISVMRCPVFDFDVKELAYIRIEFKDGSFYDAVKAFAENGNDRKLRTKIKSMLKQIEFWKELKNTITLEELVRILMYETGYFDYCSGLPVGKQRISNLRLLAEKAGQFEQNSHSGLFGFISYIEAMKKNNLSVGEAKTLGENDNVVRVMTVHKSKGLEFPIVILTGAGRQIRYRGTGNSTVMHKDFALGMPHVNLQEKWHRKTLLQRVIDAKKAKEEFEEEIRILYVAMTRAMDKLILAGTVKEPEKLEEIIGRGKSFLEMVYEPMREAGDVIKIHEDGSEELYESEHTWSKVRMADVFNRSRAERDEELISRIDSRLSFVYPFMDTAGVKSKYSVTEINRQEIEQQKKQYGAEELRRPVFSEKEKGTDSVQMGTLMHLVMEKLDFKRAAEEGLPYIAEAVEKLYRNEIISEEEKKRIRKENIAAFFEAEIGRRAAMSQSLHKEREFIMRKEINGIEAIVQGIIDCYFEEEDGMVLIDYKNSYIADKHHEEEMIKRYKAQIRIYSEALEAASEKKVKERYLYLFSSKRFISVEI